MNNPSQAAVTAEREGTTNEHCPITAHASLVDPTSYKMKAVHRSYIQCTPRTTMYRQMPLSYRNASTHVKPRLVLITNFYAQIFGAF